MERQNDNIYLYTLRKPEPMSWPSPCFPGTDFVEIPDLSYRNTVLDLAADISNHERRPLPVRDAEAVITLIVIKVPEQRDNSKSEEEQSVEQQDESKSEEEQDDSTSEEQDDSKSEEEQDDLKSEEEEEEEEEEQDDSKSSEEEEEDLNVTYHTSNTITVPLAEFLHPAESANYIVADILSNADSLNVPDDTFHFLVHSLVKLSLEAAEAAVEAESNSLRLLARIHIHPTPKSKSEEDHEPSQPEEDEEEREDASLYHSFNSMRI